MSRLSSRSLLGLLLGLFVLSIVGCGSTSDVSTGGVQEKEKEINASRAKAGVNETSHDQ